MTAPPNDFQHLFIVLRKGKVMSLDLASGLVSPVPFIDISVQVSSTGEQGLLGMAFDPDYSKNDRFYLNYVAPGGAFGHGTSRISQFSIKKKKKRTQITETILLSYDQLNGDHNGGWIGFSSRPGDKNNLYIATGDGGCCDDRGSGHAQPGGNAQSKNSLLGKILRIQVQKGGYRIPANNPLVVSGGGRFEIFASGLRNPFRASFDRSTGDLFIGDVGQNTREEIDVQKSARPGGGEDYGWRDREGSIQNPVYPISAPTPTPVPAWVDPIFDYPRSTGGTVIGGYVYRGGQISGLNGKYVFADFLAAKVFTLDYNGTAASNLQDLTPTLFPARTGDTLSRPSSLGEDASGEVYITDIGNGKVFKIVPSAKVARVTEITSLDNGHTLVRGLAAPFANYTIQATAAPEEAFVTLGTVAAGGDGLFEFEYTGQLKTLQFRLLER